MTWNWQQPDWPNFAYNSKALDVLEEKFLVHSGEFIGAYRHVGKDAQDQLKIELIGDEALKTSQIEGEYLDRESLQASLREQFGIEGQRKRVPPAENGIAHMMVDLYKHYDDTLTNAAMFGWHKMLMANEKKIETIGRYREHDEPMQVVGVRADKRKIYFEAPPSAQIKKEMSAFISWFNKTTPKQKAALPALTRAGIAHLYFVSIHPFEDGNGRIGRALSEKSLAQNLKQPTLIALAYAIERKRKNYYDALEAANKRNEITDWLVYFANTILEAQQTTIKRVDFYVAKTKFYDRVRGKMNERQAKVIARMFEEGIDGFKGGLSAENYISIINAPRATVTRDLQDLVAMGVLTKTGERRYTRYYLNLRE